MTEQIACEKCDLLMGLPLLNSHQLAHCPRCQHLLMRRHYDGGFLQSVAFAISALVLLLTALSFPFLGFSSNGQDKFMTLLQSGTTLLDAGENILGLLVIFFVIVAPLLLITTLLTLASAVLLRRGNRLAAVCGRVFYEIAHWNMIEVFVIGVVVSLVKISSMASVELVAGFWAFMGFSLCLWAAVNSVDRHQLWRAIAKVDEP
jgi:paraquat-inducible protein A